MHPSQRLKNNAFRSGPNVCLLAVLGQSESYGRQGDSTVGKLACLQNPHGHSEDHYEKVTSPAASTLLVPRLSVSLAPTMLL